MNLFTQGHALVIGVGDYQDPEWRAPITVADAQGVADALKDPLVSAYPPDQVTMLCNAQATLAGVTTALENLAQQVKRTDTVFIFFCGHGTLGDDGEYYFATQDTLFTGNQIEAGTGLSKTDLITRLRAIQAQKLLFIINACFSGHVSPSLGPSEKSLGAPLSATLGAEILGTGEGRALIMASRPSQSSHYLGWKQQTFFGKGLVDGLRGVGVATRSGYIGLFELYEQLYKSVKTAAGEIKERQEPMLTLLQGVGPFPVAFYPGATSHNLGAIEQTAPRRMGVEVMPRPTVQILAEGAQAFNKLIDFSGAHIQGGVKTGDIAGQNITKIDIKVNAAQAAAVDSQQELVELIGQLQDEVANLKDAPEDERQDAEDELRKAKEACEKGNKERLLKKLERAETIMLEITLPAAFTLANTIGTLLQRARALPQLPVAS